MNTIQKIVKNTGALFFAQIITSVIGFFYILYTAMYLGAEGFGILSFALAFTGIFGLFSDMGLSSLSIREMARSKDLAKKYTSNIAVIKVILFFISFSLIVLVINLLNYSEESIEVVYIIGLSVAINSLSNIFNSLFQALERMEYISIGRIFNIVLIFIGTLFSIHQNYSIIAFAWVYFLSSLIVLVYLFAICYWKFFIPSPEFDIIFWRNTIKQSWPFFLSAIVDLIAFKIDIIMLSAMKGNTVVGYYSAAYKILEALLFIPGVFSASIYPITSNFFVSSSEQLKIIFQKSVQYLLIISLPIAVGTTLLADKIIHLLYKGDFVQSTLALQILIWTIPAIFLSYTFGTMLASMNKQILSFKINLFGMFLNIGLNLLLIPKYSFVGAAAATVLTSLSAFVCSYYFLSKFIFRFQFQAFVTKLITASSMMGIFIYYCIDQDLSLIIVSSVVIYTIILIAVNVFSKEDLNLLKQIRDTK